MPSDPISPPRAVALLTALLDAAADAVVVSDAQGRILQVNVTAAGLFGHEPGSLEGQGIEVLMPEPYAARHATFMRHHLATGERRIIGIGRELDGRRRDGTTFPLHLAVGRADVDGQVLFVAILHDLTRRRAAEAALARTERMDALGRMTGGIAHDFNNILAIVIGNLELLQPAVEGDDGELLADALAAAETGAELTTRLLAFARRGTLAAERTLASDGVAAAVALMRRTFGSGVTLQAGVAPEDEEAIEVDRAQLQAALVNLAINARDAMPRGGSILFETGVVEVDDRYVAQEVDVAPGRYVRISVTDDGEGMDAATRAQAFEPFFTTKLDGKGTGLGLAMVYGFARQSGGHATIYSEPGHGTTVGLYFPVAEAGEASPLREGVGALPRGRGERVLVVEDDAGVLRLSIARLGALGYEVATATSADEALGALAMATPDAVFTDLVMPGTMSGVELARHVTRRYPEVAILLTSGYAGHILGNAEGLPPVLRKPFRQAELAVRLRDALDARTRPQPASTSPAKE